MRRPWSSHFLTLALLILDGVAFWALWRGSYALRVAMDGWFDRPINPYIPSYRHTLPYSLALWWLILASHGHYAHHRRLFSLNELRRVLQASFVLFFALPAMAWLLKEYDLGRSVIFMAWLGCAAWLYISRTLLRAMKRHLMLRGIGVVRVIVLGTGATARKVAQSIRDHREVGYQLVGFVDGEGEGVEEGLNAPILGRMDDLPRIAAEQRADEVFLAEPEAPKDMLLNLVVRMEGLGTVVKMVSNIMEVITGQFIDEEMGDFPVIDLRDGHLSPARAFAKRVLDLTVVIASAWIWAPVWGALALYLKATQGGPVHFVHERVGRDGRRFRLWKFRTMRADSPPQAPAPDDASDPRITRAGAWLRRTSLDELPQLLNVLKGEMSLVGPRPEMPFIVGKYEEWQKRRLDALPGITGLWQVIGRKNLPLRYNLEYDFYYIRNQSLWLDVVILLRTIPAVIFGRGAF